MTITDDIVGQTEQALRTIEQTPIEIELTAVKPG